MTRDRYSYLSTLKYEKKVLVLILATTGLFSCKQGILVERLI